MSLAGLSLAVLLSSLGTSIANVALPTLALAFGATFAEVQWVVLAYLLAITASIVGAGRLADLLGHKRLLLAGIALFTAASVLCAATPGLWLLVAARAAQGLGAAVMLSVAMALVGETVPKARAGSAMGALATMSALGTALGPTLGGMLIAALDWRALFILNLPLGLLALELARRSLPGGERQGKPRPGLFDGVGALLRDPVLGAGLLANVLVMAVMMATLVVGPFYLARSLGLDPARAGLAMSVGPAVVALGGVPAGRLADRFGAPRIALAGLAAMALGALLLALALPSLGIAGYVAPLVVLTGGYALFQTANNTAVMASIPQDRRGVVSGLLNLSRNLGLIAGASAMGAVFAFASGATDVAAAAPSAVAAGVRVTFATGALLIAGALAITAASRARAPVPS